MYSAIIRLFCIIGYYFDGNLDIRWTYEYDNKSKLILKRVFSQSGMLTGKFTYKDYGYTTSECFYEYDSKTHLRLLSEILMVILLRYTSIMTKV